MDESHGWRAQDVFPVQYRKTNQLYVEITLRFLLGLSFVVALNI